MVIVLHLVADRSENIMDGMSSLFLRHLVESGPFVPKMSPVEGERENNRILLMVFILMRTAINLMRTSFVLIWLVMLNCLLFVSVAVLLAVASAVAARAMPRVRVVMISVLISMI